MIARSTKTAHRALFEIAQRQGGYFTFTQARELGYQTPHLDYHRKAGNFERIAHGIYRLPVIPMNDHDELIRLTLWSRNEKGEPQAVISHESAAFLHELGEIIPTKVHLTVPARFRKLAPRNCIVHKAKLAAGDVEEREGYQVTTPIRTVRDLAATAVPREQLEKMMVDGVRKGMFTKREVAGVVKQQKAPSGLLGKVKLERDKRTKVKLKRRGKG
jgi:predicted transcriptional regulator of viral defense system